MKIKIELIKRKRGNKKLVINNLKKNSNIING